MLLLIIKQNLQISSLCIVSTAIPNCIDTINAENHDRYYESSCTKHHIKLESINSFNKQQILDKSKSKAFADIKRKVVQLTKFDIERIENAVGKVENAGYKLFLLFLQCFQKASSSGSFKIGLRGKGF